MKVYYSDARYYVIQKPRNQKVLGEARHEEKTTVIAYLYFVRQSYGT